jgi:hypothetical protein
MKGACFGKNIAETRSGGMTWLVIVMASLPLMADDRCASSSVADCEMM